MLRGIRAGERMMRPRIYDESAARSPVTVQVNGDLYAKVKEAGLDIDAVAERALVEALRERIREEIRPELEAYNRFVAEHGSFAEAIREHDAETEDREAV
jgi:post-segregation antitoxin (ccd killing protein)